MRLVVLESPYAGDVETNTSYARKAMQDCLSRNEAPFASHLLYTQEGVLDDTDPVQRSLGMRAGFAWGSRAEACVVYEDFGISDGMKEGIKRAIDLGLQVEYRKIL